MGESACSCPGASRRTSIHSTSRDQSRSEATRLEDRQACGGKKAAAIGATLGHTAEERPNCGNMAEVDCYTARGQIDNSLAY